MVLAGRRREGAQTSPLTAKKAACNYRHHQPARVPQQTNGACAAVKRIRHVLHKRRIDLAAVVLYVHCKKT